MSAPTFPSSYDANHPNEAIVPLPNAPLTQISNDLFTLSYQAPLTHRGSGPGIILFEPPSPQSNAKKANTLDPLPYFKWAEEGYAIAQIGNDLLPKNQEDVKKAIQAGIELLDGQEKCSKKEKYAIFVYDSAILPLVLAAIPSCESKLCTLITHGTTGVTSSDKCPISVLSHIFKSANLSQNNIDLSDSLACPVPDPNYDPTATKIQSYEYIHANEKVEDDKVDYAMLPTWGEGVYDHSIANLAHSRSLSFLKPRIGGPWFDLEKIWDAHTWYEFVGRSVAQTMGTMVAEPYVNHVPTMIGGVGRKELTAFYRDHFIFANPPDSSLEVVSRTVGIDRIVDEFIFKCNHSTLWEWFLPGVPPTYKDLRVPFIAVVCIRGDRLFHEHIWWDQATALRQCGVLPESLPYGDSQQLRLPVAGAETAAKLINENLPSNEMFGPTWGVQNRN